MLNKIKNKLSNRNNEKGNDIVVTLLMLPLFVFMLFTFIDVSNYFQAKTQIHNITRDGARDVSLYGGAGTSVPLNKTGQTVAADMFSKMYQNGSCIQSSCAQPPVVQCGPSVVRDISTEAWCETTYYYNSVAGGMASAIGFDWLENEIVVRESFRTETVWR